MYSMSFGLGPAPRIFIKLIRIPTPLLGKLYVRLIVFLDGILLVASSKKKLTLARETLIYLFSESRFSEKSRNISTRILSRYTTFGCGNQLNRNDTNTSTREKRENFTTVPGSTGEVVSLYKGTRLINWSSSINSNCSSASTSAVSSHLATTNFRIGKNSILQLKKKNFFCWSKDTTGLMDGKSSFNQENVNNFWIYSANNGFWCFSKKMGSFLPIHMLFICFFCQYICI